MYVSISYQHGMPNTMAPNTIPSVAPAGTRSAELFQFDYHAGTTDYSLPNNNYAAQTKGGPLGLGLTGASTPDFHPSEHAVAYATAGLPSTNPSPATGDKNDVAHKVYADSMFTVKDFEAIEYASGDQDYTIATPATGHVADMVALASSGHFWGYGTCEFIKHCDYAAGDLPGTPCAGPLNGQASVAGYCFESAHNSLECGRMTSKNDEHMQNHVVLLEKHGAYRCPRFAPVVAGGRHLVKRLLIGGCMKAGDATFDPYAEVHVPDSCNGTAGTAPVTGCMFPGAENHDPAAVQPAKCTYLTKGCMSPTALNYNSEATLAGDACVEPTYGCTIKSDPYAASVGVAAIGTDTPNWNSGHVGIPTRLVIGGGIDNNPWPLTAVSNYVEGANTDDGSCAIVIEGCTTEGMLNYDAGATVNSNTWCIPITTGCMLPYTAEAAATYANSGNNAHQGLAINFAATATVHDNAACTLKYTGCMSPTAINYKSHVTVDDGSCYEHVPGCLDRTALNFNCTITGVKTDATKAKLGCEELAYGTNAYSGAVYAYGVTVHEDGRCSYTYPPPPSPPPPSPNGNSPLVNEVTATVTVAVPCDQGDTASAAVCAKMDTISSEAVFSCSFVCGSVVVTATAAGLSESVKAAVTDVIDVTLSTPDAASDFLGVTVEEVSYSVVVVVAAPPSAPASDDIGLIAGAAVGAIVVVIVIAALVMFMMKKKKAGAGVAPQ